ncbi:MAG: ATP-binding cassette domain-containing protein [Pikeienuella sp.]
MSDGIAAPNSAPRQTLSLSEAEVHVDGKCLVGPLDMTVAATGVTVVMGANGAGKSQFLRLAHGLTLPARGHVRWGAETADQARRDHAYVFQNPPLMRRSVAANIEFPLKARGMPGPARRARTAEALKRARLSEQRDAPAASLSGGERQRMALARAWATGPKVLFLDEPSAALDPASTVEIERFLTEMRDEGVKLFFSTHDISQARRLADEVLFFERGKLAEQTPAAQFFTAPQSAAAQRYLDGVI